MEVLNSGPLFKKSCVCMVVVGEKCLVIGMSVLLLDNHYGSFNATHILNMLSPQQGGSVL